MKEFIQKFTDEELGKIIKIHKSYYLVSEELNEIMAKINEEPQAAGVYLGEDEKPSLALLEILSKRSDRKIFIGEKGEFLFLCGRDLMGKSIKKSTQPFITGYTSLRSNSITAFFHGLLASNRGRIWIKRFLGLFS